MAGRLLFSSNPHHQPSAIFPSFFVTVSGTAPAFSCRVISRRRFLPPEIRIVSSHALQASLKPCVSTRPSATAPGGHALVLSCRLVSVRDPWVGAATGPPARRRPTTTSRWWRTAPPPSPSTPSWPRRTCGGPCPGGRWHTRAGGSAGRLAGRTLCSLPRLHCNQFFFEFPSKVSFL